MKYRAEIDGLRALAVVPVIFFHAGFDWFSGGFVGVDVFFVISGYLITTILIDDIESNKFSIVHFYERRARRILPALIAITFMTTIVAWLLLNPIDLRKVGDALLGVATFTSNIVFWLTQGYFAESAELNPLIHTWSLAVEEQYYVLFPVFLLLTWRFGKNKVFWLIIIMALVSLLISEWGWRNNASANFYLAPTRAWELLAGSISAFIIHKRGVQSNNWLASVGLIAILFSIFFYDKNTPFPSIYALVPVLGVVLVVMYADQRTHVAKMLSIKGLVGIGLISYSAYLWHQPLFAFTRIQLSEVDLSFFTSIILILITGFLSYLSWRFIEGPFRNRKLITSKIVAIFSVLSLILIAGLGLLSQNASKNYEFDLAKSLSESEFVYFSNLDERKFLEGRLSFPLRPVGTIVVGSSRIMQISSKSLDEPMLNLSVSGAAIEDIIAFTGEAVSKLQPKKVFIGVDPWLLNQFDGQSRWKSSEALYSYWSNIINAQGPKVGSAPRFLKSKISSDSIGLTTGLYEKVNLKGIVNPSTPQSEAFSKKAYDGSHIYDNTFASASQTEMEVNFGAILNYSMKKFAFDDSAKSQLISLITWLKLNQIEVNLVLSPYHPGVYKKALEEKPIFATVEATFRQIANDLDVQIVGSYNPEVVGCEAADFYDGMHPTASCMERTLKK